MGEAPDCGTVCVCAEERGCIICVSVSAEEVSCVDLFFYVAEFIGIKAVGEDHVALCFEFLKVVDDKAVEEAVSILEGGFVDDDRDAFGFDARGSCRCCSSW